MTRVVLVRHGQASAGWGDDHDPGLSDKGRRQAESMARALATAGPAPLVTSPLRRTRETASALETVWGVTAVVEPAVGEIPSPTEDLAERSAWLSSVMGSRWAELDPALRSWREAVVAAVAGFGEDTVVVTHFVAINAVVGSATGDDRVMSFAPDNCSRTTVELDAGGAFRVVELGAQAATVVR